MRHRHAMCRLATVLAAFVLVVTACGDDSDDEGTEPPGTTEAAEPGGPDADGEDEPADGDEPDGAVRGGTLTMAMFSEVSGLDPIGASGSGVAGGTELMALYDTVMQWNTDTLEYEPRTAESLEPNEDFTQWTLTLRDGIEFRDGTPYGAEAVALSFERHKGPQNVRNPSKSWLGPVESWEVIDDLTIEFTLSSPWPGFPYALSREPGMLVSPAAVDALGDPDAPEWQERFDDHNRHPEGAGAGPFEVVEFRPTEVLIMERNPDYWRGEVYLDELRFIVLPGPAATLDALGTGDADVGFIRAVNVAAQAKEQGFPGHEVIVSGGDLLLINNGLEVVCQDEQPAAHCSGVADGETVVTDTPGESVTVRRAVAHAIDPDVVNRRVYDGVGLTGGSLFHESFPWDPEVPGPEYDPDLAAELVQQAMDEGWDGTIRLVSTNSPERIDFALAIESLLEAVGMEVDTATDLGVVDHITLIIRQRDFDLSAWGISLLPDETAVTALVQNWLSDAPTNRVGYASERMDEAIRTLRAAATEQERVAAFRQVAEVYNEEVPSLVIGAQVEYVAWQPEVHGIVPSVHTTFYLDEAWVEQ